MATSVPVLGSLRNKLAITLITGVTVLTIMLYFVVREFTENIAQQSQDAILLASVTSILDSATLRDNDRDGHFQSSTFMNSSVRQVTATRTLSGADTRTRIVATVAQTQDSLSGTLDGISRSAALYGAVFFSLAVLLSVWAASSTINPLKRLADSVARRGPHDLNPIVKPVPSEMVPLVSSFNNLMLELEKSGFALNGARNR